jgi:hypothetical protein
MIQAPGADKHSSLFGLFVNYKEKKCFVIKDVPTPQPGSADHGLWTNRFGKKSMFNFNKKK